MAYRRTGLGLASDQAISTARQNIQGVGTHALPEPTGAQGLGIAFPTELASDSPLHSPDRA